MNLYADAWTPREANALFHELRANLAWRQDTLTIHGRRIPIPRLQAWYGDASASYGYSGLTLSPLQWSDTLLKIRARVEALAGHRFNSVLSNFYRDGNDSVSWHRDNEPELGQNPAIASVSLGAVRRFELRLHKDKSRRFILDLPHASVLVMSGALQHHWEHRLAKVAEPTGARINLTFRHVALT